MIFQTRLQNVCLLLCLLAIPQISIHRGQLQMLLLDAVKERLGDENVFLGHALSTYDNSSVSEPTALQFISRRQGAPPPRLPSTTADVVIAADGINSTVRASLYPDEGPARFSGRILWRGSVEGPPFLTGASMICAGHADQKFLAYPISASLAAQQPPRSQINWIAELRVRADDDPDKTPPARADWTAAVPKSRFAPAFADWKYEWLDIPGLIEETSEVFEYPMCDRDPIPRWSFGRLTLLGDAAHPMYPIGSNGASQAILDAAYLTRCLLECNIDSDIPGALKKYEGERLPLTAAIVHANRGNGPDHVCEVARERAPNGFKQVSDIFLPEELEEIGAQYKRVAGFEKKMVNELAARSDGLAEKRGLKSPQKWISSN